MCICVCVGARERERGHKFNLNKDSHQNNCIVGFFYIIATKNGYSAINMHSNFGNFIQMDLDHGVRCNISEEEPTLNGSPT